MKIILGDNQFFGINHSNFQKGLDDKTKFSSIESIKSFIYEALSYGMDGFMINSHAISYDLINNLNSIGNKEIHFSLPYAHKYANMVNDGGFFEVIRFIFNNSSFISNFNLFFKFIYSREIFNLAALAVNLEIQNKLPKGSRVYLQNLVTDMLIGLNRSDIILDFIKQIYQLGYLPGIVTLNPVLLNQIINSDTKWDNYTNDLVVCFNLNKEGFNVFPSLQSVENLITSNPKYKIMVMSIFSSGSTLIINESIEYIKDFNIDYVVFGTSNLSNLKNNLSIFHKI